RSWRPRSAKNRKAGLVRWWAARRCAGRSAERAALLALLVVLAFQPSTASGVTEVGVIEGQVGLENAQGRISLSAGEAGTAQAGLAPRRIEITPRDQVRWAIYYPPAMWDLPAAGSPIDPLVYSAWQAWRAGNLPATVRDINAISSTERLNADSLDYLSAILISFGRVTQAPLFLYRGDRAEPTSPLAPAFRAI